MNDRHRTIARYNKRHRRKDCYTFDLEKHLVTLADAAAAVCVAMYNFGVKAVEAADAFSKALLGNSQLTPEHTELLKEIRGDGSNEPNNESESMGE